jgi:hypothetical protein
MDTVTFDSNVKRRIADWAGLIRAEYLEVPGLSLTLPQAQRLWGLDEVTSCAVFEALVDAQFLKRTRTGGYVLVG